MANWLPLQLNRAQLEERRLAALDWTLRGTHPNKEIADHFGVSIHTVYSWKARLKKKGTLQATVAKGPPTRLLAEQHELLRTLLREGPLQHGFPDDTWTTRRVRDLIGRSFGVWYHADHVRKVLHLLGFTPQMPDGRAAERNELRTFELERNRRAGVEKKRWPRGRPSSTSMRWALRSRACVGRPGPPGA